MTAKMDRRLGAMVANPNKGNHCNFSKTFSYQFLAPPHREEPAEPNQLFPVPE